MEEPWTTKNRIFWENDSKFQEFNDRLFNELWSFDEVLKISTVETFNFKTNKDLIFKKMKIKWLKYVDEWNEQKDVLDTTTCKGYAAVTFLFIVLPFKKPSGGLKGTELNVYKINKILFLFKKRYFKLYVSLILGKKKGVLLFFLCIPHVKYLSAIFWHKFTP